MNIKSSLSDLLAQLIVVHRNSTELWDKLVGSLTSTQQNIVAEITDPDTKNIIKVSLPSIKYLQTELDRLNKNVSNLSGLDDNTVIRTKDGEFKKIIIHSLSKDPDSLTSITTPTSFKVKNNWFFEKFLNPLLCVNFDYTGLIPDTVKQVEVTKIMCQLDTIDKINWYKNNYQNRSDIVYDKFLLDASQNSITYIIDVDYEPLAVRESIYYGDFNVLNIYDDSQDIEINGVVEHIVRKKYQLDTLNYNSKLTQLKYTETLKVGDELIVNTNNKNTKYSVTEIDISKSTVVLQLQEGFDNITIGSKSLTIYAQNLTNVNIEVPVGFDNYLVMFIRPIDDANNIISNFYSPGTAFYTNDLQITLDNGNIVKLGDYYNSEVVDFGQYLLGIAKDTPIPSVFANTPNAPVLDPNNFKVVIANQHLTDKKTIKDLKSLQSERNTTLTEINEYTGIISDLKNKISTKNYSSVVERQTDLDKLTLNQNKKDNKKSTFNSLVEKISNYATQDNVNIAAKYRARGFWDIPLPKTDNRTGDQTIIQFVISYRYLNTDGDGNPIQSIPYKDINGNTIQGSFSDWTEYKSDIRKKVVDPTTGQYIWADEETTNSDVVNINQLDLAITKGESIQIRIKSVSEAGFPANPAMSNWSEIILIDFPAELAVDQVAADIIAQSQRELVKVEVDQELDSLGIKQHLADTNNINGKLFVHNSKNIDSGFITNNSDPINLYDKIKDLNDTVASLQEALNGNVEDITIFLTDEQLIQYPVNVGYRNDIFAGYYRDIVVDEAIKMGSIVTRIYTLNITNNSNTNLILESLNKGASSAISDIGTITGIDYNYSQVPIGIQNNKFDQQQVKGQFIYSRYSDIKNNHLFDGTVVTGLFNIDLNNTDCIITNTMFGGSFTLDTTKIYVHQDHPDVIAGVYTNSTPVQLPDNINITNLQNIFVSTTRIGFSQEDKYLIGQKSTGSFLYLSSVNNTNDNLRVDGDTIYSTKIIKPKTTLQIPIVFQFRMTDYYGDTSVSTTSLIGRIGGVANLRNISYSKTIGFDFYTKFGGQQGFDLQFTAKYAPEGTNLVNKTGGNLAGIAYAI